MKKKIILILVFFSVTLVGCGGEKMENKDNFISKVLRSEDDYEDAVLKHLENKYGEEFVIRQQGGSFAAQDNTTKKFICRPKTNENTYCFVTIKKDLSEVKDTYVYRLVEEEIIKKLEPYGKELFGKDIKIKINQNGNFSAKYSKEEPLEPISFMEKYGTGYSLSVFIKSENKIDKKEESEKIYKFTNHILEENIKNSASLSFYYVNEKEFSEVDEKYLDLDLSEEVIKYYAVDSNLNVLNTGYSSINTKGDLRYDLETIESLIQ